MTERGRRPACTVLAPSHWLALVAAVAVVAVPLVLRADDSSRPAQSTSPGTRSSEATPFLHYERQSPPSPDVPGPAARPEQPPDRAELRWRLVASDDFDGTELDTTHWSTYGGVPGCCPDTVWDASQVRVSDGMLNLVNGRTPSGTWLSGGVGSWNWPATVRTYGRYEVRVRMDPGAGFSAAALLWPDDDEWPPELDFWEILNGSSRRENMRVSTHWKDEDGDRQLSYRDLPGDFTEWHVARVDWMPHRIVYYLDGAPVHVEQSPSRVPRDPMWLGLQTHVHRLQNGALPLARSSSTAVQIDWVRVYAPVAE